MPNPATETAEKSGVSSTSSSNSDDHPNGGRLEIDLQEDEITTSSKPADKKQNDQDQDQEETVTETKDSKRQRSKPKQDDRQSEWQSQRKRTVDRGLDGGYWSRMSLEQPASRPDNSDRKRRRTTVDRLEYLNTSNTSRHNASADGSIHSESTQDEANEANKSRFVLFKSKSFLTVRNETGGFFLCQAVNSIYEDSKKCKVQWLEETAVNTYKYGYVDWVDPSTLISKVTTRRLSDNSNLFKIDEDDLKKVNNLLEIALKNGGIIVEFSSHSDDSDEQKSDVEMKKNLTDREIYDKEDETSNDSNEKKLSKKKYKNKKINEDEDEDDAEAKETKKIKIEKPIFQAQAQIKQKPKSSIEIKKIHPSPLTKILQKKNVESEDSEAECGKPRPKPSSATNNGHKSQLMRKILKKQSENGDETDEVESEKEAKKPSTSSVKKGVETSPGATQIKKRKLTKVISNRFLEENKKVQVYQTDPFFEDSLPVKFISPFVQSKLAFRAVYLGDLKLLKSLIDDTNKVTSVHISRSVFTKWTPAEYALYLENKQALDILIDDFLRPKHARVQMPETLFEKFSTGSYNQKSLGVFHARKLTESRGVREGNQAFNKDQSAFKYARNPHAYNLFLDLFDLALEHGSSVDLFDYLVAKYKSVDSNNDCRFVNEMIYKAVLFGHRKLAAHVLENAPTGHGFNQVHTEVLKAENDSDLKCQLRANQCTKKPFSNDLITPIHCACINPNVKYLKTLLSITQDFNISDKKGRRPVHYAAVCEGPTPLEYLIARVSAYEIDSLGNTPLHYACLAGRSANVEILLSHAQKKQEDDSAQTSDVMIDNKYGLGGLNKPNRRGQLPIHLAVSRNNYDCLKVLIKYGCNVEYPLPNSVGKITPLMYAAQLGCFKIVKLLVENNAKIEARDRYQRNSLVHAALSGNCSILTYFLRMGANANSKDSSGNTCLHYAAAYGWSFAVKSLIEAGANVNLANEWKLTPFGAAFLKGHVGICDQLLLLYPSQIDVNFRTDNGETLVMLSVSSSSMLNETSVGQLDYIVNKLNANVKLRDSKGNNAFHYLAANRVDLQSIERAYEANVDLAKRVCSEQDNLRVKMADLLLKAGCSPSLENNECETPFYTALAQLNYKLARYLLKTPVFNVSISSKATPSGNTLLSLMASKCAEMDPCFVIFGPGYNDQDLFTKFKPQFEEMAQKRDETNKTPFQLACLKLSDCLRDKSDKNLDLIGKFLIFLYKNCKSDPNELIYEKLVDLERSNEADDDDTDMEVDGAVVRAKHKRAKFTAPIFKLISNKTCKLVDDLAAIELESDHARINFNLFDSEGQSPLLRSIQMKETKFSLKLIDLLDFNTFPSILRAQVCKNELLLNESVLQLCIRHSEIQVFEKILDLIANSSDSNLDTLETFIELIKHQNLYKHNLLHLIAESDSPEVNNPTFLANLNSKLAKIASKSKSCQNLLNDLCQQTDKLNRTPVHLCLLNSDKSGSVLDLQMFFIEFLAVNCDPILKAKLYGCKDKYGRLPLHYLFLNSKQFDPINSYTSEKPIQSISVNKPGEMSIIDPVELLTILLTRTPSGMIDEKDSFGYTPLHYAAVRGSTISCSILISAGCSLLSRSKVNPSSVLADVPTDLLGNTPLSSAVYFKRETCVLQLLRSVNQNIKIVLNDYYYFDTGEADDPASGSSGLKCVFLNEKSKDLYAKKCVHLYELILKYKWEGISWLVLGDLANYGLSKFDAIQTALMSLEFSLALRLIEKFEREMKSEDFICLILDKSENQFGRGILHTIACLDSKIVQNKQILERILSKILSKPMSDSHEQKIRDYLLSKDSLGSTALHYACFMLNFDLIDFIFEYSISNKSFSLMPQPEHLLAELKDKHEQTCYSLLFWQIGNVKYTEQFKDKIKSYTTKYLSSSGVDHVSKANYPFVSIPNFGHEDSILGRVVIDYPQLSQMRKEDQISPLLYAIKRQNFDICKFMLRDLNFDVNTSDSAQISALVYAIRVNNINICNLLLNVDFEPVKSNTDDLIRPLSNTKSSARMRVLFSSMPSQPKQAKSTALTAAQKRAVNSDDEEMLSDDLSEHNDEMCVDESNFFTEFSPVSSLAAVKQEMFEFSLKSNIQLNRLDSRLRTVFHHLACPLDFGSYMNVNICKLVFQAFESKKGDPKFVSLSEFLKRVDSSVKTACDYALKNGNFELYEEFRRAQNVNQLNVISKLNKFQVKDDFYENLQAVNFTQDAQTYLKNLEKKISQKDVSASKQERDYFRVDSLSNMNKIGSLVWHDKPHIPYDVILTKTDVSYGLYGMHNFYKMQIITHSYETKFDENQMCVLFTRWGRIGETGQCQRTPFSNFKLAKDEFCKIFKQKTGNDFTDTVIDKKRAFESKPRRYNLVKIESRLKPKLKDISFDLFDFKSRNKDSIFAQSALSSCAELKEFWLDLLDVEYLKNKIHSGSTLSVEYLPLTQLSTEVIQKASDMLVKELKPLIEKRMELEKLSKKEHVNEYMSLLDQINKTSNEFYELVPQMNYNYEKLKPISNESDLDQQMSLLNQLSHAQIACRILMGAKQAMGESPARNPFDYVYKSVNCKLELLDPIDMETQYILRYANASQRFKIKRIFKFERPGEEDRFDKFELPSGSSKIGNRVLLWHGTRTENLVSIMCKGLVKAPSDAKANGQRFGKGIYFSDSFEFSSSYSSGRKVSKEKSYTRNYILLCEVALGRVKELRTSYEVLDKLPVEFDSVKSMGRMEPDPNNKVVLPNGCVIPLGDMVQCEIKSGENLYSRSSNENQYVVYNEGQVCIRYILQYELEN